MNNLLKTGVLADATPLILAIAVMCTPITATLISSAPGRKIELSTAGGADGSWYAPDVDGTTGSMINIAIMSPVTHIRFTGIAGDVYRVQ